MSSAKPVKCPAHFFSFCQILHHGPDVAPPHRRRPALREGGNPFIPGHLVQQMNHAGGHDAQARGRCRKWPAVTTPWRHMITVRF